LLEQNPTQDMREGRPSSTATLIAAATVFLNSDPRVRGLVPAGAAAYCRRFIASYPASTRAAVGALCHPALRWLAWLAERSTVPGLMLHFMLRKRLIESAVREAISRGASQVVVLGAGFDTLALRLHRAHPSITFIEIDHPATQRCKRETVALDEAGDKNLIFQPADFTRQTLDEVLANVPVYRRGANSVFVIEGVLMYLTQTEVSALFRLFGAHCGNGSRVAFTVMEPMAGGRIDFHNATPLVKRLLRVWREPFTCGIAAAELPAFLHRFGFVADVVANADTLRSRYLADIGGDPPVTARGELVCIADKR
jgi:methyltransferase (TIGR00027 family)